MRRATALVIATLALVGCSGDAQDVACIPDDEPRERGQKLTIAVARTKEGERVRVAGALVTRKGGPTLLCTALLESYPPGCGGPSLRIVGLGDAFRAIEGLQVSGPDGLQPTKPVTGWSQAVTAEGRIADGALHFDPPCEAARAIEHFRDETEQTLLVDAFLSNDDRAYLNFEQLSNRALVRKRHEEWGRFAIIVALKEEHRGVDESIAQLGPYITSRRVPDAEEHGVVWVRIEKAGWNALTEYDDGRIVLEWLAGERRAVDERWHRLDEILAKLN